MGLIFVPRAFFLILVGLLFSIQISDAADGFKIGVINFQQIYSNSSAGKFAQIEIKEKGEALKSELQKRQSEIKELQDLYKKEAPILSKEKKQEKEREILTESNDFRVLRDI